MPVWRRLVEPVAAHIADAMEGALSLGDAEDGRAMPGMAGMEQMLRPMLRTSGASMFGLQLGQGLGQLADRGGRRDRHRAAAERAGPRRPAADQRRGVRRGPGAVRSATSPSTWRCASAPGSGCSPPAGWLREQMLALVEQYASGITIDTSALEEAVGQIDPNNLAELSSTLEGGLFEPQKTPGAAGRRCERLETMLALVEGWVDEVVTQATAQWMPAAGALAETVRRARATGGPAEATFATLVGLELRPRRMRDAANLWAAVRDARGADGRDAVWSHPDLVPTSADLDDPLGFVAAEPAERPATTTSTPPWPSCWTPSNGGRPGRGSQGRRRSGDSRSDHRRAAPTAAGRRLAGWQPRRAANKIDCGGPTLIISRCDRTAGPAPARART